MFLHSQVQFEQMALSHMLWEESSLPKTSGMPVCAGVVSSVVIFSEYFRENRKEL